MTALLAPRGWQVVPCAVLVDEDADTFAGNAAKKALAALAATGLAALADDSGLEVDALGGAPGVRSARYAGPTQDDSANNAKLLGALTAVSDTRRSARFRCALVWVSGDGTRLIAEGTCEGTIAHAPRGSGGFGYDPLFIVGGSGRTMAELSPEEKNRISHRARACAKMVELLASIDSR
jgi:XTP/dITP diphosphohydrolase